MLEPPLAIFFTPFMYQLDNKSNFNVKDNKPLNKRCIHPYAMREIYFVCQNVTLVLDRHISNRVSKLL